MARLLIFSDIHLTIAEAKSALTALDIPAADVCVVAGDVSDDLEASFRWLSATIAKKMPVVFVLGNHEFFGQDLDSVRRDARRFATEMGVYLLDNNAVKLAGIRFVGSTLWTDFKLFEGNGMKFSARECMMAAKRALPDFVEIHANGVKEGVMSRSLLPKDTAAIHEESKRAISEMLNERVKLKTVVVTHHAPHLNSIGLAYKDSPLSAAYASDLTQLIEDYEPDLWIHGHVHETLSYSVGKTQIICNSRGYARHPNPNYLQGFIVKV
jgi:Icc-related predicted phosphoesterase